MHHIDLKNGMEKANIGHDKAVCQANFPHFQLRTEIISRKLLAQDLLKE